MVGFRSFHGFVRFPQAPQMDEYLTYRETLGYEMKTYRSHLRIFDRYLKEQQKCRELLEPSFFLEMRANLKMEPSSINTAISAARTFFQFLLRRGYYKTTPLEISHISRNIPSCLLFLPQSKRISCSKPCAKGFIKQRGVF